MTRKIELNPTVFEILLHRMWQITSEMAQTMVKVSGSAVTAEARDYMTSLYTAEGNGLMIGAGVTYHGATGRLGLKHIIEKFSRNPGILDGDFWLINDTAICAPHQPDWLIFTPIFYKEEIVAWSGTMTHMPDIGSIDPGGFCPNAREIYHEGIRLQGIKLAENGEIKPDIESTLLAMSRDPGMLGLEIRAQMAAGTTAKRRVLETIEEFGIEFFKQLCVDLLLYSEMRLKSRLKEIPNGTWRTIEYLEDDGLTDRIYKCVVTMTKTGDTLTFDFTGTSEQSPTYVNCAKPVVNGAVFTTVATLIGYDIPWNDGIMNCVKIIVPDGTIISATTAPRSLGSIGGALLCQDACLIVMSEMLLSSGIEKYRRDASAQWNASVSGVVIAGVDQRGNYAVTIVMDELGGGMGARCYADGVDVAALFVIPESLIPNVERMEFLFPMLYIYRREGMDTAGPGKYRGGCANEIAFTIHDAKAGAIDVIGHGFGSEAAIGPGLYGGYPAAPWQHRTVINSDINMRIKDGTIPISMSELNGTHEVMRAQFRKELHINDVYYNHFYGGGGYGDPLDRSPELVRKDVVDKRVSLGSARTIHGVIIDSRTFQVDMRETERERDLIRETRRSAARMKKG
jgi:N-methylhydantoinase B